MVNCNSWAIDSHPKKNEMERRNRSRLTVYQCRKDNFRNSNCRPCCGDHFTWNRRNSHRLILASVLVCNRKIEKNIAINTLHQTIGPFRVKYEFKFKSKTFTFYHASKSKKCFFPRRQQFTQWKVDFGMRYTTILRDTCVLCMDCMGCMYLYTLVAVCFTIEFICRSHRGG